MHLFERSDVGIIPNNAQRQFPFEQALNIWTRTVKPCVVFPEIKADFKVDMTDIQNIAEAMESFTILRKGKAPVPADWIATPVFASNEFWGSSRGGSLARRALMVRLPNQIRRNQADGKLFERLSTREISAIIMNASYSFAQFAQDFNGLELSGVLEKIRVHTGNRYFQNMQKELEDNTNPMCQFLRNARTEGLSVVGGARGEPSVHSRDHDEVEGRFITWERFTRAYRHFHGHNAGVVTPEMYEQPFKSYGIVYDPSKHEMRKLKVKNRDTGEVTETPKNGPFVYGIMDLRTTDEEEDEYEEEEEALGELEDAHDMSKQLTFGGVAVAEAGDHQWEQACSQVGGHIAPRQIDRLLHLGIQRASPQYGMEHPAEYDMLVRVLETRLKEAKALARKRKREYSSSGSSSSSSSSSSSKRNRTNDGADLENRLMGE
ncbi:MAG: hypothetical protein CL454_00775 [Acidimicrobiaceae bacterium]|nr:hypothetical protein [Acidimicrobiaceae bacterium]